MYSNRRIGVVLAAVMLGVLVLASTGAEARRDNFNQNARNNANGNGVANANCNSALILVCDNADGAPAPVPGVLGLGGLVGGVLLLGVAAGWRRRRAS